MTRLLFTSKTCGACRIVKARLARTVRRTGGSMTTKDAIKILRDHNAWRRGDDDYPMSNPRELGLAIDYAVRFMSKQQKVKRNRRTK